LGHSRSKVFFDKRFADLGLSDHRFENFELDTLDALDAVLNRYGDELRGFAVTIPYKQAIMPRLNAISPEAQAIGAVNCVTVRDGRLTGHNTDAHGFRVGLEKLIGTLRPLSASPDALRALVLGTGGASRAVRWVLESEGIEYRMVSRTPAPGLLTYNDLSPATIAAHRLIINATPLGTYPDVETKPTLPYDAITAGHFLFDLVYNPPLSAFLAEGARRGAKTLNGEAMLVAQAGKNLELWNL
jgi:shikimate dehydrogenase